MESDGRVQVTVTAPGPGPGGFARALFMPARRLWIPLPLHALATGPGLPCDVQYTLDEEEGDGPPRLVCVALNALRRPGGPPVTATLLRQLPVGRLIESALRIAALPYDPKEPDAALRTREEVADAWAPRRGQRGRRRLIPDTELAKVAKVYRDNPDDGLLAVSEEFDIGRTTAWRYVDRAKKAGYSIKQRKRRKR